MATKTYSEKLRDPRWQKKRLSVLERDNFTCRMCFDTTETLNVHHISYNNEPWETEDRLLITLCETCHNQETEDLKEWSDKLIKSLKKSGFTSLAMAGLARVFTDTDRDWKSYEPAFLILKMVVDNDDLWNKMYEEFCNRP